EWNRMEEQTLAFHQAVRAGYLRLAGAEPDRWVVVDASQAPETVHTLIAARVLALTALAEAQIR
ncbi:MAG: hypothetical protein KDE20_22795, partial [Caldilineaceae bacterium]|nr:hypothetical protein [Caldilineaceae bacterium]